MSSVSESSEVPWERSSEEPSSTKCDMLMKDSVYSRVLIKSMEPVDLTLSLIAAYTLRAAVLDSRYVPTDSMDPTFKVGDSFLNDKFRSAKRKPKRGQVVCFKPPDKLVQLLKLDAWPGACVIKRVVAVEGDRVQVRGGRLYVNGQPQDETYAPEPMRYSLRAIVIPDAHVFVLGDNRNRSLDSHVWGPLPCRLLLGRPFCTYWPPSRMCGASAYANGADYVRGPRHVVNKVSNNYCRVAAFVSPAIQSFNNLRHESNMWARGVLGRFQKHHYKV